jgi:hypothetical protein
MSGERWNAERERARYRQREGQLFHFRHLNFFN